MVVIFLRTLWDAEPPSPLQEEAGRLTLIDGKLVADGQIDFTNDLLHQPGGKPPIDLADTDAVKAAMRDAPARWDGAYLRAKYVPDMKFTLTTSS